MTQPQSPDIPESGLVFNVPDYKGRRVRLTQRTYDKHVPIHPKVEEYVEEAKQVVEDPDDVIEMDSDATFLYRHGLGRGVYA
jgi:hypothetical protein